MFTRRIVFATNGLPYIQRDVPVSGRGSEGLFAYLPDGTRVVVWVEESCVRVEAYAGDHDEAVQWKVVRDA